MATLASVIMEGLDASKPAASIPGRLYFTTDTDLIYYDTGTAWEEVGPSGEATSNATEIQGVAVSATAPTSGQRLVYNGTEWVPTTVSEASIATTSAVGVVQPDGETIDVTGEGVISVPTATTSVLGLVKPDGTTITITDGVITAEGDGGGMTNPMTTAGDIIIGGTSGAPERLGVGSNGQVLTVASGAPAWAAASTGFTNPMTTEGDLIVGGSGGSATRLGAGTAGQILTSQGSGSPLEWTTPSGGSILPTEAALTTPVLSDFTLYGYDSTGISTGTSSNGIYLTNTNAGEDDLNALLQTITTPANPWTATGRFRVTAQWASFYGFGIHVLDSVSSYQIIYGWFTADGPIGYGKYTGNHNAYDTQAGFSFTSGMPPSSSDAWFRIHFDGTYLNFWWSVDGNFWVYLGQTAVSFFPNKPNQVGFGMMIDNVYTPTTGAPYNIQCFSWTLTQP